MVKVGTDIVSIDRVTRSLDRFGDRFLNRFLTPKEIASLSLKPASIAGYWATKEAISKALGCGIGADLAFGDIEIYKDSKNAPFVNLKSEIIDRFNIKSISVSISHDGGFAIAVVALEVVS